MKTNFLHFETLVSTNLWAKEHASELDRQQMTIISANVQTSGRGRLGRSWHSPAGKNIYATFCFFVDPRQNDLMNLPQIMALAAAEMLEVEGFPAKLKWPNDLLLSNKKIGGILSETRMVDSLLCFSIGIGLNVNLSTEDAAMIDRPVTSLLIESARLFDIEELLQKLAANFQVKLDKFLVSGFVDFLSDYRHRMVHEWHAQMQFSDSQKLWQGRFHGINPDGSLSLELPSGEIKKCLSGELS